ncbi:MAG: hypothetical protein AAGH19_03380 [Pseudomonadota bacterium]
MNDDALYAFDLCHAYPLPGGRRLVRNPRNGRHALLTPDVYGALLGCRRFQTLTDHAERLVSHNPALTGQEADVRNVLASVRDDGLMISADAYAVTLQPAAQPRVNVDKPVVAVITWERPDALKRCLESVGQRVHPGNVGRFIVIDDSRTAEVCDANRATTERFAECFEAPVLYLGASEQKGFMEAIIRQVRALEDQVRFLIDREHWADQWTSGLARTLALLLSVGQRLIVLDDDIVCDIYEPEPRPGIGFAEDEREARFYAGQEEWAETPAADRQDPVARHMALLGSELRDALGALGATRLDATAFAGADLEVIERWRADSPVLMTECGSLGDAGTGNLNWLATLRGDSLKALLNDEAALDKALVERSCWLGQYRPHIVPRANMSQLTGVDNRGLMPPYTPILRGEDRLFGDMVEFLRPDGVIVDQPWAVAHLPMPARRWDEDQQRYDTNLPFDRYALGLVERARTSAQARDPLKRLAELARIFELQADQSVADIRKDYDDQRLRAMADDYGTLQGALDRSGDQAPEAWQAFLGAGIETLNRALVRDPAASPAKGEPAALEGEALIQWWQDYWVRFGRALRAWPAIRQAARQVQI